MKMLGSKAKFAVLCIAGLLIFCRCSKASEHDEDFESDENRQDLSRPELSVDDVKNENDKILQTNLDAQRRLSRRRYRFSRRSRKRFSWRRRRVFVTRRRFIARRRISGGSPRPRGSRRRRWGWR